MFIPQLTLNMAVLDANAATTVIETNTDISCWVIGGHSLGGVMAAQYAKNNQVDGQKYSLLRQLNFDEICTKSN